MTLFTSNYKFMSLYYNTLFKISMSIYLILGLRILRVDTRICVLIFFLIMVLIKSQLKVNYFTHEQENKK